MKKENTLLILWIIFGYIFITAVDSVLYFIIHLIYFSVSELSVSYNQMKIILPSITLFIYGITTIILIKKIQIKSKTSGIYLTKFPEKLTILLGVIAFGLSPITNKLIGLYSQHISENNNFDMIGYLDFHGCFYASFGISQLLVTLSLFALFITKLQTIRNII